MTDPHRLSLTPRGSLNFCPAAPPRPCGRYVYQLTAYGKGNVPDDPTGRLQLRRWVMPADPRTPAQVAHRAAFAAAVAAWQSMPQEARDSWRIPGKARNLPAYNAFLSAYLAAASPD